MKRRTSLERLPAQAFAGCSLPTNEMPFDAPLDEAAAVVANGNIVVEEKIDCPTTGKDSSSNPPPLSYLVCLNALTCGMEFCVSAGFAYIPPLLLKIGLSETSTTCLMGVGPFLALSVVPALGRYSDNYRSRFGRRRPFILVFSLLVLLALVLIPFGETVGVSFGSRHAGIFLTAIGIALLDFSSLCCLNPTEALVSDTVRGTGHAKWAFTVHSCMLSVGGCIGFLVTSTGWMEGFLGSIFATQEQIAFSVIFALLVVSLLTTLFVAREKPSIGYAPIPLSLVKCDLGEDAEYNLAGETFCNDSGCRYPSLVAVIAALRCGFGGATRSAWHWSQRVKSVLRLILRSVVLVVCTPVRSIRQVNAVPTVLQRLFVADFCSWAAILCLNMFYTDYVAQAVFLGNPNAAEGSRDRLLYDLGVRKGSWDLLLHSIVALLYASLLQDVVIRHYGIARAYLLGLAMFAVCMILILTTSDLKIISACTAVSGVGFSAVTTIPNTLVTGYQSNKALYFFDDQRAVAKSSDPTEESGMATDIAVLNSAYYLAQISLAVIMGPIIDLSHSVTYYIVVASFFGILACISGSRIIFTAAAAKRLHGTSK